MMKITGLSHLFKWENLHNWWLTKYFFAPLYIYIHYHNNAGIWIERLSLMNAVNAVIILTYYVMILALFTSFCGVRVQMM